MRDERRGVRSPTAWILVFCFAVSIAVLIIYLANADFSDDTLFLFLAVIRYSSFMVFICSLYKVITNILCIFRLTFAAEKSRRNQDIKERRIVVIQCFLRILLYLVLIVYGLGIFFFESFIIVFSGGNV